MTERVELLSPAGNLEKLRFAVDYGADAVYCAPERFGMRAAAGNFTPEALAEGADYAHRRGAKLYVTLNTMPRDSDLALLPSCVAALRDAG
ncbi:MAG: U32 family peptidase, partial [Clostridiales bacterium]|nr:U32 family peptidase [Clostridiales bacterium]